MLVRTNVQSPEKSEGNLLREPKVIGITPLWILWSRRKLILFYWFFRVFTEVQ